MQSPSELRKYYSDEFIHELKEDTDFGNVKIEPHDLILLPKFRYVRKYKFNVKKHKLLLAREDFLKLIAEIDRWYIYLLFDIMHHHDLDARDIVEASWQLMHALDKDLDRKLGRKEPLLTLNSKDEFPPMQYVFSCYLGDFPDLNAYGWSCCHEYAYVSFKLPEIVMKYIDGKWPEYNSVSEFKTQYEARNGRNLWGSYKIGTEQELAEAYEAVERCLNNDTEHDEYLNAINNYYKYVNRTKRFLFIAAAPSAPLHFEFDGPIKTINLDLENPLG